MHGLHPEMGFKGVIFALVLEVIFLGICVVFVGLGVSEIKKRGQYEKNIPLILLGICLAGLSFYVTQLLIQG